MTGKANGFDNAEGLSALLQAAISGGGGNSTGKNSIETDLLSLLLKAGAGMDTDDDDLDAVLELDRDDWRDLDLDDEEDDDWSQGRGRVAHRELAALREVNDTLADALGACRACWGGDDRCPDCRGRGSSGYRRPDPRLFRELVSPALKAFQRSAKSQRKTNQGEER